MNLDQSREKEREKTPLTPKHPQNVLWLPLSGTAAVVCILFQVAACCVSTKHLEWDQMCRSWISHLLLLGEFWWDCIQSRCYRGCNVWRAFYFAHCTAVLLKSVTVTFRGAWREDVQLNDCVECFILCLLFHVMKDYKFSSHQTRILTF